MAQDGEAPEEEPPSSEDGASTRADGTQVPPKRFRAKYVFMTFAALSPGEVSKARVRAMLKDALPNGATAVEWIICHEDHPNPTDPAKCQHVHAFLHSSKRYDIQLHDIDEGRTHPRFYINTGGRIIKPFLQQVVDTAEDRRRVLRYIMKEGNFECQITDMKSLLDSAASSCPPAEWATEIKDCESVDDAMELLKDEYPEIYFLQGPRVRQMLQEFFISADEGNYTLADFTRSPLKLESKAVVLHGPVLPKTATRAVACACCGAARGYASSAKICAGEDHVV